MQQTEHTNETLIIYSNNQIHLDFFDPSLETLRPFDLVKKPLSELSSSNVDHVSMLMIDTQADLALITSNLHHCLVIIANGLNITASDHLSNAIVYQRQSNESAQDALAKVFYALVKFYFSTYLLLDDEDFRQAFKFAHGKLLNIACFSESQLLTPQNFQDVFSRITEDDTVMINLSFCESSFSTQKFHQIIEMIEGHLIESFDGELLSSCILSSESSHQNRIYINFMEK